MSKRSSWLTLRGLPPARRGGASCLVTFDVDAPVGARAGAQHARRAVVLAKRDHATGTDRRRLLDVRVLHRVAHRLLDGAQHRAQRDAEPLDETGKLWHRLQTATFRIAVIDDVEQRKRDQHLPREPLQLIFTESRVAEAHPHDDAREHHHLGEHDQRAGDVHPVVDVVDRRPSRTS